MALPAQYLTAVQVSRFSTFGVWLEIEGLPNAYGNFAKSASWFSSRSAGDRLLTIKSYLQEYPKQFDAMLDPLKGVPEFKGQAEFALMDYDGEPTGWTANANKVDWLKLAADIDEADTTITYDGTADPTLYPATGTLYIGTETITYTGHVAGSFTGCVRARYRSRAQSFGVGFPIVANPITMKGRKAWLYQIANRADGVVSLATDDDKVLRFNGRVDNLRVDGSNLGVFRLTCLDINDELVRSVFRELGTLRDLNKTGIAGPPWDMPGARQYSDPGGNNGNFTIHSSDCADFFGAGDNKLVLIDDELIAVSGTSTSFNVQERGCFNTPIQAHKPGFTAREVAWLCYSDEFSGEVPGEHSTCKFTSAPTTESPLPADHPLMAFLQMLLSTGTGLNTTGGGARNYDVLPESWGLGIAYDRVDIAGIVAAAAEAPGLRGCAVWKQETKLLDIAVSMLAPYGFFLTNDIGYNLTVRRLRPPMPNESTGNITAEDFVNKNHPSWDANYSGAVQEVIFNHSKDIRTGEWQAINRNIILDAKLLTNDQGRRIVYDMPLLYEKGSGVPGSPRVGGQPNVNLLLLERADYFRQGWGRPPPIIQARVTYKHINLRVGDVVTVTHALLPNVGTGERGIIAGSMRVLRVRPDDESKTIELTLLDTGYNIGDYRVVAPSLEITSVGGLGGGPWTIGVETNAFVPTIKGKDMVPLKADGSVDEWMFFSLQGGGVEGLVFIKKDFSDGASAELASYDSGAHTFVVDATPVWLTVGDFVTVNLYESDFCAEITKAQYAFAVDADLLLGPDAAHKYFP